MHGNKIDVPSLFSVNKNLSHSPVKTLMLTIMGVFLLSDCVMTKAQGDNLLYRVREVEDEVAKLQRVRHDMEVLMVGQVGGIIDRVARMEKQLVTFRESLSEGSTKNSELLLEIQNLRGELEIAQRQYQMLEQDQKSLLKNQSVKEAQTKVKVPSDREEHFALAKKYFSSAKFDKAVFLFDQFIKEYPNEKDLVGQSYYSLGEIYYKLAKEEKSTDEAEKFYKKSIISYQKVVELNGDTNLREESLYKIGLVLKAMGNKDDAASAFKEIISKYRNGKRVKEAKKHLVELDVKNK
jgi:TolA-binding protein